MTVSSWIFSALALILLLDLRYFLSSFLFNNLFVIIFNLLIALSENSIVLYVTPMSLSTILLSTFILVEIMCKCIKSSVT